jgi:hypothetical protein
MDQTGKTLISDVADTRKWIGRILMAVILGEAIWNLIVSVMNNLVVPWLGDVMGQSSGLPTSFTRRPYDYPDLFVSVLEFCIAGITAVALNYFFQRPRVAGRAKRVNSSVLITPAASPRVVPELSAVAAMTQETSPVTPPLPEKKPDTVISSAPLASAPPSPAIAKHLAANPAPPPSKSELSKPKKPKEVYYNSVGEPVSSDED